MLELLAALAVLSALILVGVVFRPTPAQEALRVASVRGRESEAFLVLGAFPTQGAVEGYENVVRKAAEKGIVIDWDRARREQATATGIRRPLSAVALDQL